MHIRPRSALFALGVILIAATAACWLVARRGFSAREKPSALEAFVAGRVRLLGVPARERKAVNPVALSAEVLANGRAHFADHCATCHGNDGKGATAIGKNLYPKAPDMTLPATQNLTDGELFWIIKNGVRLTGMPAWGADTPEDDRATGALVHLIRHLPKISASELAEMQALNPKGRAEFEAEEEERRFLEGDSESKPSPGKQPPGTQPHARPKGHH